MKGQSVGVLVQYSGCGEDIDYLMVSCKKLVQKMTVCNSWRQAKHHFVTVWSDKCCEMSTCHQDCVPNLYIESCSRTQT